jgi:DsbC/DsbD-like thiol-disulfide interchange protein
MVRRERNRISMKTIVTIFLVLLSWGAITRECDNAIVQYSIQRPDKVRQGKKFAVGVLFTVKAGWYIYAPTGANADQGMIETNVTFSLPRGIVRAGKIKLPDSHFKNGHEVYEGDSIMVSQALKIAPGLTPGPYEIKGRVTWQTCSSDLCLPPVTDEIRILIDVKK